MKNLLELHGSLLHRAACTGATLLIEHDVFRFEVPVNDSTGVEVTKGQGDLSQVEATHTNTWGIWHGKVVTVTLRTYSRDFLPNHNLLSRYHAVSSMKIPSFSSCMKSSPPESRTKHNQFSLHHINRWFMSQYFPTLPSFLQWVLEGELRAHRWDTPGWGRASLQSGRRRVGPRWTGVSPSPESLAPLVCELYPLRYTLFSPTVEPKKKKEIVKKKKEIDWKWTAHFMKAQRTRWQKKLVLF